MPERILRAVASPPMIFWAPQVPAMINMAFHGLALIFGWGLFKINPLILIVTFLLMHMFIASHGAREPHLSTLMQAWAACKKPTRSLIKSKTKKYVP